VRVSPGLFTHPPTTFASARLEHSVALIFAPVAVNLDGGTAPLQLAPAGLVYDRRVPRPRAVRPSLPHLIATLLSFAIVSGCGGTNVSEMTVGPTPVRCELSLGSGSASVPASASQVNLGVVTAAECTWAAQSNAAWLQVAPASGQGAATLSLNVAANSQQTPRTTAVTVNGVQFSVTQAAATAPPPPPCNFVLNPTNRSIGDNGGTRSFTITTTANCSWTATTTATWITFDSPVSGSGSGRIDYRVARNSSSNNRVGTILVGGQSHTVNQEGD
jgi:hypothetical protein